MPKRDTPLGVEDKDPDPVETSYRTLQRVIRLSEEGLRPNPPPQKRERREEPARKTERPGAKKRSKE